MRRRRGRRSLPHGELNLLPLMNILIVLIPMLLLSAVFIEMRSIEMNAPQPTAAAMSAAQALELAIVIDDDAYVIEGNGILSISIARPSAAGAAPGDAAEAALARALQDVVAGHRDNQEIRIVAKSTTRYEEIVALMDLARAAGLNQPSLAGRGPEA
jgi:biopolymer transport protein ExbD